MAVMGKLRVFLAITCHLGPMKNGFDLVAFSGAAVFASGGCAETQSAVVCLHTTEISSGCRCTVRHLLVHVIGLQRGQTHTAALLRVLKSTVSASSVRPVRSLHLGESEMRERVHGQDTLLSGLPVHLSLHDPGCGYSADAHASSRDKNNRLRHTTIQVLLVNILSECDDLKLTNTWMINL